MKRDSRTKVSPAAVESAAASWILRRDAGMSAAEQSEFERWRAADPRHADAIARKDRAWSALGRPLEAGQADELLERLAARRKTRRRRRLSATVAGLMVLLVGGLVWKGREATSEPLAPLAHGVVHRPATQILADGSIVELRPGAGITVDFSGALRRVTLSSGEAHFQVAKNKDRPFVVTAGNVEFRAVGTAFSVQLGAKEVELLVTEGRVAVGAGRAASRGEEDIGARGGEQGAGAREQGAGGKGEGAGNDSGGASSLSSAAYRQPLVVDAGNRVVVELAPQAATVTSVPVQVPVTDMAERMAWRAPKLEFSEVPLSEAVTLMNRHNKVQFVIKDPELARLPVSGLFRADNTETFVRLLESAFDIKADRSGDTIVLYKAR